MNTNNPHIMPEIDKSQGLEFGLYTLDIIYRIRIQDRESLQASVLKKLSKRLSTQNRRELIPFRSVNPIRIISRLKLI